MARALRTRLIFAAALLPLALGVAACKKDAPTTAADATSAPVATVPPPAGKAWSDVVSTTPDGGYLMGNPNAPIKLIEYGSLSCPHCAKLAKDGFQTLVGTYVASGRVSFEYRSFVIHGIDVPLTLLAGCSGKEAFFPLVEQIYANQDDMLNKAQAAGEQAEKAMALPENQRFVAASDAQGLTAFFAQRGISVDQAHMCLADFAKATQVAKNAETYGAAGVDSTPTLFINGSKIPGNTWDELSAALQRAGAR
ncbi:MAG: thioredoxin domain-containing protein [Novosphingobium sp.]